MKNVNEIIGILANSNEEMQKKVCDEIAKSLNENSKAVDSLLSVFTVEDLEKHLNSRKC